MQQPKRFASISFRLTALHLGLSIPSIVVAGAIVSIVVGRTLTEQMRERLLDASRVLQTEYAGAGLPALEGMIRRQGTLVSSLEYRLEDKHGRHLVGDLPPVPRDRAWSTTRLPDPALPGGRGDDQVLSYATLLADGELLVVGEELGSLQDAQRAVLNAFAVAMGGVVVVGVLGGALLHAIVRRRVGAMAEAARSVMAGNLTHRIEGANARDELGWLSTVFNHMLDRTSQLVEINRQIGADLAHDLRSPLAHLLGRLERARLRATRIQDYEEAVDGAVADVNQILSTFNAILRIAQVEAGTRRASFRRTDVSAVLLNVAEAFTPVAQDHQQDLTIAVAPGAEIEGDQELLTQLFANLIENAIRHTGSGAQIEVACAKRPGVVEVVVSDTGPGIPAKDRARVLERFVRLDSARSTPGSGLGFTLCAAIVDLHEGSFTLDENGPGLRCVVQLPAPSGR